MGVDHGCLNILASTQLLDGTNTGLFRKSCGQLTPPALCSVLFDKLHVAKHLHDAVDQVRKAEHRTLKQADDHRLTNAGLEAVNATIQWIKKIARWFRYVQHFKTAIYFHCGGLDLYPH